MLTLLLPAAPVMAHAEATAGSGILALAHQLVHILQASPLLQALIASAVIAAFAIFRINKRES